MGVLNLQQPNFAQHNQVGSQLAVTALEMLLKRYLDKKDAETAETGANAFLNQREGLPTETTYKPQGTILEGLFKDKKPEEPTTPETPTEPSALEQVMKKEGPGLPTPPEKSTPELEKLLTQTPEEPAGPLPIEPPIPSPMYARNMPPAIDQQAKMQVAPGQKTDYYSAAIQQQTMPRFAEYTDPNTGVTRLVEKKVGQEVTPKASAAGQVIVYDKQGNAYDYTKGAGTAPKPIKLAGGQQLAKETATESRTAYAQEQQRGRFQNQYDPVMGRVRPYSAWELRQLTENRPEQLPASPEEAKRIEGVVGKQAAVFNASENARQAAINAIQAHGRLGFDPNSQVQTPGGAMSLSQMATYVARLTHGNEVIDSSLVNGYLHGLVNAATDAESRAYANHLLTLFEAGVAANSMIGGSAQQSDMRYRALLGALPGPTDMEFADIDGKLNRFETDLALSVSSLPNIKSPNGFSPQDLNRDLREIREGKPYQDSALAKLAGIAGTTQGSAFHTPTGAAPAVAPVTAPGAPPAVGETWEQLKARKGYR